MELTIQLSKAAERAIKDQVTWYLANCGASFAQTFTQNIKESLDLLCAMPSIGNKIKGCKNKTYRYLVIHPRCTIFYWHTDKLLFVAKLRFSATR